MFRFKEDLKMELYLVRHGQSKANAKHIMQGAQVDEPLTNKGRQQAKITRQKLSAVKFDRVFSSPLKRASETAAIITGSQATVTFDRRLVEFDYGKWDGQRIEQLVADYPEYFKDLTNFGNSWRISGGETYQETQARLASFEKGLNVNSHENVLVVTHGMTIKLWTSFLLKSNSPERIAEPANASFSHFSFYHGVPILKAYSR